MGKRGILYIWGIFCSAAPLKPPKWQSVRWHSQAFLRMERHDEGRLINRDILETSHQTSPACLDMAMTKRCGYIHTKRHVYICSLNI